MAILDPLGKVYRQTGLWVPQPLRFAGRGACCGCKCTCEHCLTPTDVPCCWNVAIAGIVNKDPVDCSDCAQYNGAYSLAQVEGTPCEWTCSHDCDCNPSESVDEEVKLTIYQDGSDYKIKVEMSDNDGINHTWEKDYGAMKPDCCKLSNESLSYVSTGGNCDGSAATCAITAMTGSVTSCSRACAPCGDLGCPTSKCIAPATMFVDLGVGGLTNTSKCDNCDGIAGVFQLDRKVCNPGYFPCCWEYKNTAWCVMADCWDRELTLNIDLFVDSISNPGFFRWGFVVTFMYSCGALWPFEQQYWSYLSAYRANGEPYCIPDSGKVQLDFDTSEGNAFCGGALPDPVYAY